MTSSGGGGRSNGGDGNGSSPNGKNVAAGQSYTDVDQLNKGLGDMSLESSKRRGWEVSPGYKVGDGSRSGWETWGQTDSQITGGWGNDVGEVDNGNESEDVDESEDELVTDDYDSDESQKSHDSRKKNVWFAEFFGTLDDLTVEQIKEPARQWHCPACQNGPGSIYWFRSMKSFLTHIKTKGTRRAKIHRDLAELLDEELCRRGVTLVQTVESYGQWKGIDKDVQDWEIVWPPMVIVVNTQLEQDENGKWTGMGTQELLDYFNSYEPVRARASFGPEGHRGISVLIFENSAVGYLEAERLSKHFERQGTDRNAWDHNPIPFHPGGKRQLYGYLATEKDLDIFNQHAPGKLKLKFELVSYQEKVVNQLKQMNKDSQQLPWYKNKIAKQEMESKALEATFEFLSEKLRRLEDANRIVRQRTQLYHEQQKEEMDSQESFFKDQLKVLQDARDARDKKFEKLQQEVRAENSCEAADADKRKENSENFIELRAKEMEETEEERERVMKEHEDELKRGKEEIKP